MLLKRDMQKHLHRAFIAAAGVTLSGCATLEQVGEDLNSGIGALRSAAAPVQRIDLSPAERIRYRQGQVFVFGKDDVRKISRIGRGLVVWSDGNRELYRTREHFFLPRTHQVRSDRVITRQFAGDPGALWPLAVGKEVSFTEQRTTSYNKTGKTRSTTRNWHCKVQDARKTRVHAGTFDTYRVRCTSFRDNFRSWRSLSPLQTITWDYAPKLGHYVRREIVQSASGRHRIQALSAALPPSLATPHRIDAVLQRLQRDHTG